MRYAFEILKRFFAERRGHAAIITALAAPVLVGSAGLGVEAGYWFYKQRVAQMSADIAAYSGAVAARSGGDSLNAVVQEEAARHGYDASLGMLTINNPPTGGPNQHSRAVEVRIDQTYPRLFSALFLNSDVTISVRAVALFQEPSPACILALEKFDSDAMTFTGDSDSSLNDCELMSNSIAPDALSVQGSASVTTTCANAVGGVNATAGLTLTDCSEPHENAPPAPDPYESLPAPTIPGGCENTNGGNPNVPRTITPGHYCSGLDLRGDITLEPGVYVVSGDVTANANANIAGDGVTIYVRNNGRVRMNGTANVDLTAPGSGTYEGVLFFGDRNNGSAVDAIFNGTADSNLEGVLYFPNQEVMMRGDFNGSAGCTRVISRWVDVSGDTSFDSNCANTSIPTVDVPGLVKLVE